MSPSLNLKSLIYRLVFGVLTALLFGGASYAKYEPLFVEAVDYTTIETVDDCEETLYRGKQRKYSRCANPDKLFETARTFALKNNMPLVILWGFDSCPACESLERRLFDPDMLPTNKAVSASLTLKQKTQFSEYTNGTNQIALVRMNSGTSVTHNQDFANKIGANKVASALGWKKVWSPMFMVVNPKTKTMAANEFFSGYRYCTLGEKLAEGLTEVGILNDNPNWEKSCSMPRDHTDEELSEWEEACESGINSKCFWTGSALKQSYYKLKKTDIKKAKTLRSSAEDTLNKACDNGHVTACRSAGRMLTQDGKKYSKETMDLFRKACGQNDLESCAEVGFGYRYNEGGLRKDYAKAATFFAKACDAHDPWACGQLGELAFYKLPGTKEYQSQAKPLIAFGCRAGYDWACKDKYK